MSQFRLKPCIDRLKLFILTWKQRALLVGDVEAALQ